MHAGKTAKLRGYRDAERIKAMLVKRASIYETINNKRHGR